MRFPIQLLAILFIVLLAFESAHAIVEIKGGFSWLMASPKELNEAYGNLEDIKSFESSFTGDILLNMAMMPINLGARYEKFNYDQTNAAGRNKVEFERISLILNKRFIETGFYLGSVATVGLSNEFKDKVNQNKASSSLSGSVGLETGIKLGFIILGIEGGYLIAPLGNLKTSAGTTVINSNAQPVKVDLSGTYARAVVGLDF